MWLYPPTGLWPAQDVHPLPAVWGPAYWAIPHTVCPLSSGGLVLRLEFTLLPGGLPGSEFVPSSRPFPDVGMTAGVRNSPPPNEELSAGWLVAEFGLPPLLGDLHGSDARAVPPTDVSTVSRLVRRFGLLPTPGDLPEVECTPVLGPCPGADRSLPAGAGASCGGAVLAVPPLSLILCCRERCLQLSRRRREQELPHVRLPFGLCAAIR